MQALHVVTGAFGYSGRYIARRLLDAGHEVRTLTNKRPAGDPFSGRVKAWPLCFEDHDRLTDALRGADVLYNTYWVRFNYGSFNHAQAVRNTRILFDAATLAGVRRIVHVSITNPSEDSQLGYFRGKAQLESALKATGLSYAILRPAVLFGGDDILINNIAWLLRRVPFFGVFGDGQYKLQPIHVDDFAKLAVDQGAVTQNVTIDAIGPETFTYRDLVRQIANIIGVSRPIVSIRPGIGYIIGRVTGWIMRDMVITRDEIKGLMSNLLCTNSPPAGVTRLSVWAQQHAANLGTTYASELARRNADRSQYPVA